MSTVYVSIGNSDDKLTQKEWAMYCDEVRTTLLGFSTETYGGWFSEPTSIYQNACFAAEVRAGDLLDLYDALRPYLARYRQDSIALSTANTTLVKDV